MVASATPPVQEALQDGVTGALVDYFDGQALIDRICELLKDPETRARYGAAARDHVLRHYDLETVCLPPQIALIERVASGALPRFTATAGAPCFPGVPSRKRVVVGKRVSERVDTGGC